MSLRLRPRPRAASPDLALLRLPLAENRGDVQSLGMFSHYIWAQTRATGPGLRTLVLAQLGHALAFGLMSPGALQGSRHIPWGLPPAAALARVAAAWEPGTDPGYTVLQSLCWLENTPAGDAAAPESLRTPAP